MEGNLYPTPEFVNTAISTGNIELLESLYKLGLTSKYGKNITDVINSSINDINSINQYPLRFENFPQLAKFYYAVKKLGRLPFEMSNGYIVIARNQKIFYALDEFMDILRRSPVRGMRVIFEVDDNGIRFPGDKWSPRYREDEPRSFCLRKIDDSIQFVTHIPEKYNRSHPAYDEFNDVKMLVLTQSDQFFEVLTTYNDFRVDLGNELKTVEKYFDPNFEPIDSRIRFVSYANTYELAAETLDLGATMVFLSNLQDDGEYSHEENIEYPFMHLRLNELDGPKRWAHNSKASDYISNVTYVQSIIRKNLLTLTFVTFNDDDENLVFNVDDEYMVKDELFTSKIHRDGYAKLNTVEEKCSFISFFVEDYFEEFDERLIYDMGLYWDEIRFDSIEAYHACVNTKNRILCLITKDEVSSTREFRLVSSHIIEFDNMKLYINSIVLA